MTTHSKQPTPAQAVPLRVEVWFLRTALALLAVAAIGLALATLWWPLGWDGGIFSWIADATLDGGAPYLSAWDMKGPASFFGYAIARGLFGRSAFAVRLFDLIVALAGCWAFFSILRRTLDRAGALAATLLLYVLLAGMGYSVLAQPDLWASWCLVAAVALVGTSPSYRASAASAAFVSVAILVKPVYAPMLVVPLLPALVAPRIDRRALLRHSAAVAVGASAPVLLTMAWFWSRGALGAMYEAFVLFNLEERLGGGMRKGIWYDAFQVFFFDRPAFLMLVPLALVGVGLARGERRLPRLTAAAWLAFMLLAVVVQGRWWAYQWSVIVPPLVMAAALGAQEVLDSGAPGERVPAASRRLLQFLVLGIVLLALRSPAGHVRRWASMMAGRSDRTGYEQTFTELLGGGSAVDIREAAAYVQAHTRPGEPVLVWEDVTVNVASGRPTPGRFAFTAPIMTRQRGIPNGPLRTRYVREMDSVLTARPPRLVLMERRWWYSRAAGEAPNLAMRLPWLHHWIGSRYGIADSVGKFLVLTPVR